MSVKHQMNSFRTIHGVKWMNWGDCLSVEYRDALKAASVRTRNFTHPDGFVRTFIHPDDEKKAVEIGESMD